MPSDTERLDFLERFLVEDGTMHLERTSDGHLHNLRMLGDRRRLAHLQKNRLHYFTILGQHRDAPTFRAIIDELMELAKAQPR